MWHGGCGRQGYAHLPRQGCPLLLQCPLCDNIMTTGESAEDTLIHPPVVTAPDQGGAQN